MSASRLHLLLVDNGSLEPASVLSLRRIAEALARRLGRPVSPLSMLHSNKIPADKLEGRAAETFETGLNARIAEGKREFLVVPLFFGPSAAITDLLPACVARLRGEHPALQVHVARFLVDVADHQDERMALLLADNIRRTLRSLGATKPIPVILVDHGSPKREVSAVRDHLAGQLRKRLENTATRVLAASMERRPGTDYDFNEPLLEKAFQLLSGVEGPVIVSMLFLQPGRHAGAGGDIETLCEEARRRDPRLQPVMTPLVGEHEGLIDLLSERAQEVMAKYSVG